MIWVNQQVPVVLTTCFELINTVIKHACVSLNYLHYLHTGAVQTIHDRVEKWKRQCQIQSIAYNLIMTNWFVIRYSEHGIAPFTLTPLCSVYQWLLINDGAYDYMCEIYALNGFSFVPMNAPQYTVWTIGSHWVSICSHPEDAIVVCRQYICGMCYIMISSVLDEFVYKRFI